MAVNESHIKALMELVARKFADPKRTEGDLRTALTLLQEALEGYSELHGLQSHEVARVRNYLGLVNGALNQFEEADAEYTASALAYVSIPLYQAVVLNNHADMLNRQANLALARAAALKEECRTTPDLSPPATQAEKKRKGLRMVWIDTTEDTTAVNAAVEAVATAAKAHADKLRDLASANEEAALAFQKSAGLAAQAYKLANEAAEEAKKNAKTAEQTTTRATAERRPTRKQDVVYQSPSQIMAALNQVVVGQYAAKRGLANAASQHMRRMQLNAQERAMTDKSNILMTGATGTGKTLLAQALASAINVPFYRTEATKITASGYVGEDVQVILAGLLRACNFDVERAQNGIIYLDEIDKKAANKSATLDVGGESVQEELLTLIEGTKISVPKDGNNRTKGEYVEIDTTNILFILGGAFVGLGEIIARRRAGNGAGIGFSADLKSKNENPAKSLKYMTTEDLVEYGIIPELVGRLPIRLVLEPLTVDELSRILLEPKKALLQQKRLLLRATTDLRFTRGAVRAIAQEAEKAGTNGRALREIVEQLLAPVVFGEPKAITITAEMVRNRRKEAASGAEEDSAPAPQRVYDFIVEEDSSVRTAAAI